jgi:hypothetical protein
MKNKKAIILLITIMSLLIFALIGLMIFVMNNKFNIKFRGIFSQRIEELQIEETYKNNYEKININTDAADVYIKQSEDEDIHVKIYSEKEKSRVIDNEIELNIEVEQKKCVGICINNKISKVEVYIPENYEKEIKIDNKYGDIEIASFENLKLEIKEDAGDIKIDSANIVNINNNYGDIKIGTIKEGTIKESAGDITINKVNSIDIKNNYGDTKIEEINEYLKLDADAGDIKINILNITKDSFIETNAGDVRIEKANDIYVDAETDVGSAKVNNNNRNAEITLKIENNVGDIKVN